MRIMRTRIRYGDTHEAEGDQSEAHGDSRSVGSPEGSGKTPLSAVSGPEVGPGGNNHSDGSTDDGDNCSNQKGDSSVSFLRGKEQNNEEHNGHKDEADKVLLFEEFDGSLD